MSTKLATTEEIAKSLMLKYELYDYTFSWDSAKRRYGRCSYGRKIISLSRVLTELREEAAILNTILHEIAHAIVYRDYHITGHNETWRKIFISIGGNGLTCSDDVCDMASISKYIGYCPNGHVHYRDRIPKRETSCGICCVHFNEAYIINYRENVR